MSSWQGVCDKFELLTRREQWLIAISGWIALLFVGFMVVIEPQVNAFGAAKRQLVSVTNAMTSNDNQLLLIERKLQSDPNLDVTARIARLETDNALLDEQLDGRVASLVNATEMSVLMEQVLQRSKRLKLVSLSSLPSVQLLSGDDQGFYIHPVRLTLRGRYFDVVAYLQQLEALPVKYYWRSLNYQVDNYPWADIQLEVYTLGESKDFIGG
ncbi:MSHA biogenesis protein MshJ [Photobacterium makurazakiensis]|uniref:MSHA biogenesis protein MshJ n=1 Tax=Photobacterium TaxID=657 RepID=UPI003D113CAE